jgi:hypothetical protein
MTKPHWLDRPENHHKLWMGFIVVLVCTVLAEWLWPIHGHFEIESIPGFNALYGFVACAAMVAFAKLLGLWLKRSDTFYGSTDTESTSSSANAKDVAHE